MRTVNTELLYRRNRNQRTDWPEFAAKPSQPIPTTLTFNPVFPNKRYSMMSIPFLKHYIKNKVPDTLSKFLRL